MSDKTKKGLLFLLACLVLFACGGEGTTTGSGGNGGVGGTGGSGGSPTTTTSTPDPIAAVLNTYGDEDSLDIPFGPYLGEEGPVTGNVYEEDGDWAGFLVFSPGGTFTTELLRLPFYQGGQACVLLDTTAKLKAVASAADLGDPNDPTLWDESFNVLVSEMKQDGEQNSRWKWEKTLAATFEVGLAVIFQVHGDPSDPNGIKRNCPIAYATNDTETPNDVWGHFQVMCGAESCGWNPLHLSPLPADALAAHWAGDVIGSYIPLLPAPPPVKAKPKVIPLVQKGTRMRPGLEMYLN